MSPRRDSFSECATALQGESETEGKKDGWRTMCMDNMAVHLATSPGTLAPAVVCTSKPFWKRHDPGYPGCPGLPPVNRTLGPAKLPPPVGLVSLDIIPLYGARFRLFVCR